MRRHYFISIGLVLVALLAGCTSKPLETEIKFSPQVVSGGVVKLPPTICADAPIAFTWADTPALGNKGRIIVTRLRDSNAVDVIDLAAPGFTNHVGGRLLHSQPIRIEGKSLTIALHAHILAPAEKYRLQIEPGVLTTINGGEFKELATNYEFYFSTKTAPPKGLTNITVAADNSGDFATIQGAVDYVSDDNQTPVQIFVRKGTYDAIVYIAPTKDHLHFIGEDRDKTIISGFNNDHFNPTRGGRALMSVEANDFTAENLTIHNTTPYHGSQAEALRVNGDRCVLRNCNFASFQDTVLLSGRVYVTNCYIEGDVDFIWGQGTTFFDHCEIKAVHSGYYLQSRNSSERLGYIFHDCRLTRAPGVEKVYLARIDGARFPYSQAAFIDCAMGPHILPVAWQVTGTTNYENIRFEEFHTTDFNGRPLDISQRHPASHQLDESRATDLSDPAKVFTGQNAWDPRGGANASTTPQLKIFDVRDSGAKGDGTNLDTVAIQKALDACGDAGGGIVRLPPGTYLSKPIYLHGKTTLLLCEGATLKATDVESDFADPSRPGAWRAFTAFVNAKKANDITIAGPGTIDGSGAHWWGPAREAKRTNTVNPGYTLPRPHLVVLSGCTNVQVTNVTFINSPCFHLVPRNCDHLVIDNVTIKAPADSPNTDAIDPSECHHVLITHCTLDTGDDNIAIKGGRGGSRSSPVCDDITVTDCTFLHGHGMSIGSETAGGVRNVIVRHCTFQNTENGLRIKSPRGRGGAVENLSYSDITMENVDPAITFTCYYPRIPKTDEPKPVGSGTPAFHNIRISNLTATCPRSAGVIVGLPESLISDITFENVHISAATGLLIQNARAIRFNNSQIETKQGPPVTTANAEVTGLPVVAK